MLTRRLICRLKRGSLLGEMQASILGEPLGIVQELSMLIGVGRSCAHRLCEGVCRILLNAHINLHRYPESR